MQNKAHAAIVRRTRVRLNRNAVMPTMERLRDGRVKWRTLGHTSLVREIPRAGSRGDYGAYPYLYFSVKSQASRARCQAPNIEQLVVPYPAAFRKGILPGVRIGSG